jgi:hypothetical protein
MNGDGMGWTCLMSGEEQSHIQIFGGETWKRKTNNLENLGVDRGTVLRWILNK